MKGTTWFTHYPFRAATALLLANLSNAQNALDSNALSRSSYMDVTFYSDLTNQCGQGSLQSTDAITFSVLNIPTTITCLSLPDIFTHQNGTNSFVSYRNQTKTYTTTSAFCDSTEDDDCGLQFRLDGSSNYNSTTNYSQVFYHQSALSSQSQDRKVGSLALQTYNGENCRQEATNEGCLSSGHDCHLGPWIQWDCTAANGTCSTVPYSVKSVAIRPIEQDSSLRDHKCVDRAAYGGAGGLKASAVIVLGVVVLVGGYLVF